MSENVIYIYMHACYVLFIMFLEMSTVDFIFDMVFSILILLRVNINFLDQA